ncbi:MAG TPA: RNA 2',3'-cyclic phosphodiesterase [candidate division Zixibacteria bacterium]|nr:RNA 2',3'-cyclic phosphodiesterase [candidate division Zixibacteria bacterium]
MSEPIRSFLAFDLDNESLLKRLTDVQTLLVETGADLKVVEPKNIHITVRFLGNVTSRTIEEIFDGMKKVQFVPFDVRICGVGAFPDVRYPRVVWAGITEGADKLRGIFSQLEPHLRSLGFAPDPKGFSPHLTIARVRSGRNKVELAKFISENVGYEFGTVRAACLRLKRSELAPKGPIYSTLKEVCPQG